MKVFLLMILMQVTVVKGMCARKLEIHEITPGLS